MKGSRGFVRLIILTFALGSFGAPARVPLTFEERVKAQEAIERVYYEHRIWPKENPQPKPPFEEMVPRAVIEARVTDYLKKSAALEKDYQRPIQPEQLQSEMERMAKALRIRIHFERYVPLWTMTLIRRRSASRGPLWLSGS